MSTRGKFSTKAMYLFIGSTGHILCEFRLAERLRRELKDLALIANVKLPPLLGINISYSPPRKWGPKAKRERLTLLSAACSQDTRAPLVLPPGVLVRKNDIAKIDFSNQENH